MMKILSAHFIEGKENICVKNILKDIENKLVVTSGEREGGKGKIGIEIKRHKLLCIK